LDQCRAGAEPEQSSRTEVALSGSNPHLSLRLLLRPFVLKQSWGTYNCKGLAVLTGADFVVDLVPNNQTSPKLLLPKHIYCR